MEKFAARDAKNGKGWKTFSPLLLSVGVVNAGRVNTFRSESTIEDTLKNALLRLQNIVLSEGLNGANKYETSQLCEPDQGKHSITTSVDMESALTNGSKCCPTKRMLARFVELVNTKTGRNFSLTIATKLEKSEGCFVKSAIRGLGFWVTTLKGSQMRYNICLRQINLQGGI
jgi:hypothetical protein